MQELYSSLIGGNKDLDPQKTIAYEIGAGKQFGEMVDFSLALFFNDIEDRIVNEKIAGQKTYMNKGETEIKGIETSLHNIDNIFYPD